MLLPTRSLLSGVVGLNMEDGDTENITLVAWYKILNFRVAKKGCIRFISWQVYNKRVYVSNDKDV